MLRPDRFCANVESIAPERLASMGASVAIVDLDNTLLPRDQDDVPASVREWLAKVQAAGFRVCLVSNNWHERAREVAAELGLPLVAKAIKPLPFAFWRALAILGVRARECVVIGDQLFTDVLGARIVGCTSIMVPPRSSYDLPHTLMLRRLESLIMGKSAAERASEESSCG
ncbi:predicted hydrolase of the HAD superfamily [Coriobacteriaceae bacterium EMTCatB1]|nr:predicted hydrolase of the HAD superfamily [Coriobacteriaceae bacterium EMTCatB1]